MQAKAMQVFFSLPKKKNIININMSAKTVPLFKWHNKVHAVPGSQCWAYKENKAKKLEQKLKRNPSFMSKEL